MEIQDARDLMRNYYMQRDVCSLYHNNKVLINDIIIHSISCTYGEDSFLYDYEMKYVGNNFQINEETNSLMNNFNSDIHPGFRCFLKANNSNNEATIPICINNFEMRQDVRLMRQDVRLQTSGSGSIIYAPSPSFEINIDASINSLGFQYVFNNKEEKVNKPILSRFEILDIRDD